jgi:hypothetical protein
MRFIPARSTDCWQADPDTPDGYRDDFAGFVEAIGQEAEKWCRGVESNHSLWAAACNATHHNASARYDFSIHFERLVMCFNVS